MQLCQTCVVILSFVATCLAATAKIVPPIRPAGDEAAVIFVPGASINGDAYLKTAQAIQKASQLRIWVSLTGNYTFNTPNPLELPGAVEESIRKLQAAGMKGNNYIGVAHSLGGVFLAPYAKGSKFKAVALLGSYLTKGNDLSDYPLPILTLSSELDGQARITRIGVEYSQLQEFSKKASDAIYKTPVINIKGANHAQFASGPMPSGVTKYDLKPEVTETQAHQMIGQHVSDFITANLQLPASAVAASRQALQAAYTDSGSRFQPLLDAKALDSKDNSSPWAVITQQAIAGHFKSQTKVSDKIETNPGFTLSKPSIEKSGSDIIVHTETLVDLPFNPMDISTTPDSPTELDIKFKSREAIQEAFNTPVTNDGISCKSLNQMALDLALTKSTPDAQRRYKTMGRPIIFKDDITYGTGIQWVSVPLKIEEKDDGLHVQSISLKTSTKSIVVPGNFYCKLLSPYRAMEWVNVDSLRAKKPEKSVENTIG